MNEGLKPCPFCGVKTKLSEVIVFPNGEKSPAYIKCRVCGYHFHDYENDKVVIAWNTRPIEDALTARLREAEAEIAALRKQLEVACHVEADGKESFDWAVLTEIFDLRERAEKTEATIKNKDIVLDAYREETACLRDDANRLAEALKMQEFDDDCWCSPEWKDHSVSDYGAKHGPGCIAARAALSAHDAGKDAK